MALKLSEKKGSTISYRPPKDFIKVIVEEAEKEGYTRFSDFIHSLVVRHLRMKKQAEKLIN